MNKIKFILIMATILVVFGICECFAEKEIHGSGLYFGSQEHFAGYMDYNFFYNLSRCTPYTTPISVTGDGIFAAIHKFKTQIVGLNTGNCIVKEWKFDNNKWQSTEYALPQEYAKQLGQLIAKEIKYPNERLKHLKSYCEENKRPSDACIHFKNGTDKNTYFFHVNLGLNKYNPNYAREYSRFPKEGKTMYKESK